MTQTLHGIIHGNRIELFDNPGLPEGEEVEIRISVARKHPQPGTGLARCAGALAESWTDEDDHILAELQQDRLQSSHRDSPE